MIKHIVFAVDTSMATVTGHPIAEKKVFGEHELEPATRYYKELVAKWKDDLRPGEVSVQMVTRYVSIEEVI